MVLGAWRVQMSLILAATLLKRPDLVNDYCELTCAVMEI
jgi:hypothetical protein